MTMALFQKNKREFRLVHYSHGVDYLPWAATDSYSKNMQNL